VPFTLNVLEIQRNTQLNTTQEKANGILSTQVAAISCLPKEVKFVSKANGICKRNYGFRMNVMEEIFEIRSCIEIMANDIKVNTADEYMLYS